MAALLQVRDLKTYFYAQNKTLPAVDGVSFDVNEGETLCVVGESGCGKSVTSLSIMRLIPVPPGKYAGGEILFAGEDILKKTEEEMYKVRGNAISMIYQEPMTSLNPVFTVGMQIMEALRIHKKLGRREAREGAVQMLAQVGISDPESRISEYPHQLSGGIRQRVMIAMALCCQPRLLIADEPTTALDVTIQAQILDLMRKLKKELGMAILFITHDLGVVAEMAERVLIMYSGKVVEEAAVTDLFARPLHPYTRGLIDCIPRVEGRKERLEIIEGMVPSLGDFPEGCRFHPRCSRAREICARQEPAKRDYGFAKAACHFPLLREEV